MTPQTMNASTKVAAPEFETATVSVRVKISALWTAMLFVFAYVDLFSLYRPDFRAEIEAGQIAGFAVNQSFLVGVTSYILIPSLMVFLSLVLAPRVARWANLVLSSAYALTIVAGAIGEWTYYVLGSAIEVVLLAGIAYFAWTWPRNASQDSTVREREAT